MAELLANDVVTTLAAPLGTGFGATSLTVTSSAGFPAPTVNDSDRFTIRIGDEILTVTVVDGTTWTVTRAEEGTTEAAHAQGAVVTHVLTAGSLLAAIRDHSVPPGTITEYGGRQAPVGYLMCEGAEAGRTPYNRLFDAITWNLTGTTTSGSTTVTAADWEVSTLEVGYPLSGPGIPVGATVASVGTTSFTISAAATASGTSTLRICPWGAGNGSTTFNVPDLRVRVPVGKGTGKRLGGTDGVAEASRNATRVHSHSHGHTLSDGWGYAALASPAGSGWTGYGLSGTVTINATGYTDYAGTHGHSLSVTQNSPTVNTASNTTTTGSAARVTSISGHTHNHSGSSAANDGNHRHYAALSDSISLSHTHQMYDNGHSHGISGGVSANTTPESAFAAVNYIIKY